MKNDDVAAVGSADFPSEKVLITEFIDNYVFAVAADAVVFIFIQCVAHGRSINLKRRDQIRPDEIHHRNDYRGVKRNIAEEQKDDFWIEF